MTMRRPLLAATLLASALLCLVVATACERSTEGTATTAASGSATSSTSSRSSPTTTTTTTTGPSRSSRSNPPSSDALAITCDEYVELDEESQRAVIQEILGQEDAPLGDLDEDVAKALADSVCAFSPDSTVNEILLGSPPS